MIRRLAVSSVGAVGLLVSAPVALAQNDNDDKYKPVYSDDVKLLKNPLPGTILSAKHSGNLLAEVEDKVDEKLQPETVVAGSVPVTLDEGLARYVSQGRDYVNTALGCLGSYSKRVQTSLVSGERSVAKTVADLRSPKENVLPNAIYILVAGLTGTIIARPRNFLVRATLPWALGTGAFAYLMPETFQNTRQLGWKVEQEQLPQLAKVHEEYEQKLGHLRDQTKQAIESGEKDVESQLSKLKKTIKSYASSNVSGKN